MQLFRSKFNLNCKNNHSHERSSLILYSITFIVLLHHQTSNLFIDYFNLKHYFLTLSSFTYTSSSSFYGSYQQMLLEKSKVKMCFF